jgi:hypothetical protein
MLCQAETGMHFEMVGGCLSPAYPPDYRNDPSFDELLGQEVGAEGVEGLRDFLTRRRVTAVVVEDADPGPSPLLVRGLRLEPVKTGAVLFYRVPDRFTRIPIRLKAANAGFSRTVASGRRARKPEKLKGLSWPRSVVSRLSQ